MSPILSDVGDVLDEFVDEGADRKERGMYVSVYRAFNHYLEKKLLKTAMLTFSMIGRWGARAGGRYYRYETIDKDKKRGGHERWRGYNFASMEVLCRLNMELVVLCFDIVGLNYRLRSHSPCVRTIGYLSR